jgi:hypothetical protein
MVFKPTPEAGYLFEQSLAGDNKNSTYPYSNNSTRDG